MGLWSWSRLKALTVALRGYSTSSAAKVVLSQCERAERTGATY